MDGIRTGNASNQPGISHMQPATCEVRDLAELPNVAALALFLWFLVALIEYGV